MNRILLTVRVMLTHILIAALALVNCLYAQHCYMDEAGSLVVGDSIITAFNQSSDGKRQGIWVEVSKNGELKRFETYCDGQRNGEYAILCPGGAVREVGEFRDGKREGFVSRFPKRWDFRYEWILEFRNGKCVDRKRVATPRAGLSPSDLEI